MLYFQKRYLIRNSSKQHVTITDEVKLQEIFIEGGYNFMDEYDAEKIAYPSYGNYQDYCTEYNEKEFKKRKKSSCIIPL